ncbi:MAG: RluA family pseudouridine synthase [Microgenomates group bacterium]
MNPSFIFEDDSLFILDKPAGWIVNEAKTTKGQKVIQTWLKKQSFDIAGSREFRSGIVHRLDKETSGVLVVAKIESAFRNLQAQFKERKIEKEYVALVHGKLEPKKGKIKVPVGRLPWNRQRFGVLPGGRFAETDYQVIEYYSKDKETYSLLKLFPKTGRTHQIRIHLKYLGYPVVADEFYAGRKTARADRIWCPRLFLHAEQISLEHPASKKRVSYKSDLPEDLKKTLQGLTSTKE